MPRRKSQTVSYNGEVYTLRECAGLLGVKSKLIYYRIEEKGMSLEDACALEFTEEEKIQGELWNPRKKKNRKRFPSELTFNGETHSIPEWSSILGISPAAIRWRLDKELPLEEVLSPLKRKRRKGTEQKNQKELAIA